MVGVCVGTGPQGLALCSLAIHGISAAALCVHHELLDFLPLFRKARKSKTGTVNIFNMYARFLLRFILRLHVH